MKILLLILLLISFSVAAEETVTNNLCDNPNYFCKEVQAGETWKSAFPDSDMRTQVKNINHIKGELSAGMMLAIPGDVDHRNVTGDSFARHRTPTGKKVLIFDPSILTWAAYDENGTLIRTGHASGGKDWCPDIGSRCHTPAGKYMVYDKGDAGCYSHKFPVGRGGAPMPYCMFFHGGYAFHSSDNVPDYNASHGCVRVFYPDARWLNREFVDLPSSEKAQNGTQVIVLPYYRSSAKHLDEYGNEYEEHIFDKEI